MFGKVLEYLKAGVRVACILDPGTETVSVYRPDEIQQILTADDEFTLPDVLPGFRVRVGNALHMMPKRRGPRPIGRGPHSDR